MTPSAFALAHLLDLPASEPWGGLVILHGAGSRKENHADMAAAARRGPRGGPLRHARARRDRRAARRPRARRRRGGRVAAAAGLPFALRGSSMGGYLALVAAERAGAAAVVAICPAPAPLLARGLRTGRLEVAADTAALEALLAAHPLEPAIASLELPVLIQHAELDEQVPVAGSRTLANRAPPSRVAPAGHA